MSVISMKRNINNVHNIKLSQSYRITNLHITVMIECPLVYHFQCIGRYPLINTISFKTRVYKAESQENNFFLI